MGTCVLREEPFPRWRPQGQLTEQRAYEDDDLHSGGELAVQLRLAELPERAAVGAGRLGPRPVARLAGVSGNPAAVMPHGEAGATALFVARPPARLRYPRQSLLPGARRDTRVLGGVLENPGQSRSPSRLHITSPGAWEAGMEEDEVAPHARSLLGPRQQPHESSTVRARRTLSVPPPGWSAQPSPLSRDGNTEGGI